MKGVTAFDVETILISQGVLAPRVICCSFSPGGVLGNTTIENLVGKLRQELEGDGHLVGHNVAFDLHCIARTWPELTDLIWEAYKDHRIHDTLVREKLIHLATHGSIDALAGKQLGYSLEAIARDRLGVDLAEGKASGVRTRYAEMDGLMANLYPVWFREYSQKDADITLAIYNSQEESGLEMGNVFKSEWLHVNMAWCLYMSTIRGLKVDPEFTRELWDKTKVEIDLDNFPLLKSSGIISPASPGRPYKRSPGKFTKATREKVNKSKALVPHVLTVCRENGIEVEKTETGRTSTSADFLENLAPLDATISEYQRRQKLSKLVTTYFPAMVHPRGSSLLADTIHPKYDVLKRTGRISSRGNSKKSLDPPYASVNIQQVDPRIRGCYVPRKGFLFLSADYSALELGALADTVYKDQGESALRDQLNAGIDPHAYLGAILSGYSYEEFQGFKTQRPDYYKHWRTMAKPVGLGFPGGMGLATMVKACRGYGVKIDEDRAIELKELWLDTYPMMREYLHYDGEDDRNYTSPLGMIRAGCNYTQYCNGRGLQTPGAEGMKLATFRLCEEIYNGCLMGCHFVASIHDEVLLEVPDDEDASINAKMVKLIMVHEMQKVLTSMNDKAIKVEAALMRRWSKRAEPVYDAAGKLVVWTSSALS